MVEYGIVKFFDEREGKRFGFLTVLDGDGNPTKEEVFFHYNDGEFIGHDGENPIFCGSSIQKDGQPVRLRSPQKDDKLVFLRSAGSRGDKACPWGFAETWDKHVQWLADRPMVRVVRRQQDLFSRPDGSWEISTVWEGQNTLVLSATHPKRETRSYGRTRVVDDLDHSSIEDGHVVSNYDFEVLKDGEWKPCRDPRVMLCCVPWQTFRKFARSGLRQDRCFH